MLVGLYYFASLRDAIFFDLGVDFWQKLFYNERATFQLFKKAVAILLCSN